MSPDPNQESNVEPVDSVELNSWRRGFTPQAEIWNGRLAMLGLSAGLAFLLLIRLFAAG
ncbi:high light inducible protein [Synechococcus sp. NOUM97013]|uniref:high light inducible protein n=1 Tax=Synechococcus sp. NOUM97013 TaxID=1442555 RepID=UPI00164957EA|nr:high light inducible protein [Synechococcus sp. NOUM97013]QNI74209.1 high light inducible protein [Synechococcus sp. NOUM97013]